MSSSNRAVQGLTRPSKLNCKLCTLTAETLMKERAREISMQSAKTMYSMNVILGYSALPTHWQEHIMQWQTGAHHAQRCVHSAAFSVKICISCQCRGYRFCSVWDLAQASIGMMKFDKLSIVQYAMGEEMISSNPGALHLATEKEKDNPYAVVGSLRQDWLSRHCCHLRPGT